MLVCQIKTCLDEKSMTNVRLKAVFLGRAGRQVLRAEHPRGHQLEERDTQGPAHQPQGEGAGDSEGTDGQVNGRDLPTGQS